MQFILKISSAANDDIERLFDHLVLQAKSDDDLLRASRAAESLRGALESLATSAHRCRKNLDDPSCRELVIPSGTTVYLALCRIEADTVCVLALRHQREDDYH